MSSNHRGSEVGTRNDVELKVFEQCGDIVDVSVSTLAFWQLMAVN